jgi:hypothetical protein
LRITAVTSDEREDKERVEARVVDYHTIQGIQATDYVFDWRWIRVQQKLVGVNKM